MMSYNNSYQSKRKKELAIIIIVGILIFVGSIIPFLLEEQIDIPDSWEGQTGYLQLSVKWKTKDDLDLVVIDPNGEVLWFGNKSVSSGGKLDIDANSSIANATTKASENIFYKNRPPKGTYKIFVNLFSKRSSLDKIKFKVRIKKNNDVSFYEKSISQSNPGMNPLNMLFIKEFRF